MNNMNDRMIEFRLNGVRSGVLPDVGKFQPGERVLLRVSMIFCLFPDHCQVRTVEGRTISVHEEDFPKVEKAFRGMYLGNQVKAMDDPGNISLCCW